MMTFTVALAAYTAGKTIKSIATNNVYALGKKDIEDACQKEKSSFWCFL